MERYCSTGQSPQRAVAPTEEEGICFKHPCAHHQENQLYQYDIWYTSFYVGDRLVCRSACIPDGHLHRVTYTRCHIDTIDSPDNERVGTQNM